MTVINIQVQESQCTGQCTGVVNHRISTPRSAIIGTICTFKCKGKLEYGRIVNVTATSIRIERMQKTANGEFILHPNQKNNTTKNVITFSRKIEAVVVSTASTVASERALAFEQSMLHGGIKRRYPNAQSEM
jgi:hypothetical protein